MTSNDLDDNERSVLIQLKHYFNRSCAIHFDLISGEWRNAIINKIDEENKKVYLKEFVLGMLEYNFNEIDANSIKEYTTKEEYKDE
jgi:Mg/Co/Ni transporter MgtE